MMHRVWQRLSSITNWFIESRSAWAMQQLCFATCLSIASFVAGSIEGWSPAITYGDAAATTALSRTSTMWSSCLRQVLIKLRFNQRWQEQTRDHIEWCLIGYFEDWMSQTNKQKAAMLVPLYSACSAWRALCQSTLMILRSYYIDQSIDLLNQ